MAASRCPHCDSALTSTEAEAGTCPECAAPLIEAPFAEPVPVTEPVRARVRSRFGFVTGIAVGALVTAAGTGAAWSMWGRAAAQPVVSEQATAVSAEERAAAAEEVREAVAAAREARDAAAESESQRQASETELATVRTRVQQALAQLEAAEKQLAPAESRLRSAQEQAAALERANEEGGARRRAAEAKNAAAQLAEAQKLAIDRATAEARNRLQAIQAQQAAADRALADVRNRMQLTQNQFNEADRQLAATRARLQTAKDQAAVVERELADKKIKLAERDRALEAKRTQLAELDRGIQAKGPRPAEPPPLPAPKAAPGFVRDWLVVGPFPSPDRKGIATKFQPETGLTDPKKEFRAGDKTVRWQAHTSPTGYVDLKAVFGTADPAVGYAVCWVRSDRARRVRFALGSKDGIKVWVNGRVAASLPAPREAAPDQDRAIWDLDSGWNEVRVKVANDGGPWGFYFEVRNSTGERPVTDLDFRTTPPPHK